MRTGVIGQLRLEYGRVFALAKEKEKPIADEREKGRGEQKKKTSE